jgi:class 3 adenylate cyclase
MTTPFDPASLSMTEIIRLQTVLSQELTRRFERKAALAFTDVVDSTRYFAQFGDEAGRRLQQLHLDLLEKAIDGDGRIVDTAGDGAFISFPSAMAAVGAMVTLQQRVSEENLNRPRQHQLSVRIGMHWGQVLTDGEQVTGDAVNQCARISSSAMPAQIRLSGDMFAQLAMGQRQRCRSLGHVPLRGVARDVELLELRWRDPARFPTHLAVHETGERITLPALDTLCFGRGDTQQALTTHDIIVSLPDPIASKQISRRHFELRSRPEGYILKALSTQHTEVDGTVLQSDQEIAVRPGTVVRLARVATLEFLSPAPEHEQGSDATVSAPMMHPRVAGDTAYGRA